MKHLKLYEDYVSEAIKLSDAKKYTKAWKDSETDKLHHDVFGGKYRLYLPVKEVTLPKKSLSSGFVRMKVQEFLNKEGYIVDDYVRGTAKKRKDKRKFKIGRLLNKFNNQELLKQFNEDKGRELSTQKNDGLSVVISRHPVDIAGMSTDRGWKSCMNIDDPMSNKSYIMADVTEGTIIAYLIKSEDTNIQSPISRILIKPFINLETDEVLYIPEQMIYGVKNIGFLETIIDWLGTWQENTEGIYRLNSCLYNDSSSVAIIDKGGNLNYKALTDYVHKKVMKEIEQGSYKDHISLAEDVLVLIRDFGDTYIDMLRMTDGFGNINFEFPNGYNINYEEGEEVYYTNSLIAIGCFFDVTKVTGTLNITIGYDFVNFSHNQVSYLNGALRETDIVIDIEDVSGAYPFDIKDKFDYTGLSVLTDSKDIETLNGSLTINLNFDDDYDEHETLLYEILKVVTFEYGEDFYLKIKTKTPYDKEMIENEINNRTKYSGMNIYINDDKLNV